MLRYLVMALLVAFTAAASYAQEKKAVVLIIPFEDKADGKKYKATETTATMIFNSMYTFIGLLPTIDVPDKKVLMGYKWTESKLAAVAAESGADVILYGDYVYQGDPGEPDAAINLKVWIKESNRVTFSKTYKTPTDLDIFDSIDDMIKDFIQGVLKTSVNVATIRFGGFHIGDRTYALFVNGKEIASVTNTDFALNLRVLADSEYRVEIKDAKSGAVSFSSSYVLRPRSLTNVSFQASGKMQTFVIPNKNPARPYTFLLNNSNITEGAVLSNAPANISYTYRVMESGTNVRYETNFYLAENASLLLTSVIPSGTLRVAPLWNKKPGSTYKIFLDGEEVNEGLVVTNAQAKKEYRFQVIEDGKESVYDRRIPLADKEDKSISAAIRMGRPLFLNVSFGESSYAAVGFDALITPNFYYGASLGGSYLPGSWAPQLTMSNDLITYAAIARFGWFFLGDANAGFRLGLELGAWHTGTFGGNGDALLSNINMVRAVPLNTLFTLSAVAALNAELDIGFTVLQLKAGGGFDFLNMSLHESLIPFLNKSLPLFVTFGLKF